MIDSTEEEFFTKKHARLTNIASAANVFAWVALASQVLYMAARFGQLQASYLFQTGTGGIGQPNFTQMLSQNHLYLFSLIVDLGIILVRGVIYWLTLRGVSLGLYMIVETNLNYKDRFAGEKQ